VKHDIEYAKSLNYDLNAIFTALLKKAAASGRKVVTLSRKPSLTIPLHTDRIKLVGESERLLAAGERGRYAA